MSPSVSSNTSTPSNSVCLSICSASWSSSSSKAATISSSSLARNSMSFLSASSVSSYRRERRRNRIPLRPRYPKTFPARWPRADPGGSNQNRWGEPIFHPILQLNPSMDRICVVCSSVLCSR
ncbi:uncharacterized protein MICPUCDRAFT_54869 [Micromonas pusilla CCMP1545]|uniref:Predicted protein n=1 Tax=Micromonas pusilla (strain CCMP1545) TaxID=564608 RepID=C1NAE6_MICPC|nr:uncharacterized protein MICPUCDRAFT_54869 [Micromonas pusilla CCMP1545]EEH50871.1 predicted protein [Micromonas pusilla CCMP1545]|eukprot:XP_003064891.1 predicted protein [Micromonas pusilla CCMP1545]